ncbi:MAG: hypothetical protein ACXITV_05410 [Luteibaculaceae bacterium]
MKNYVLKVSIWFAAMVSIKLIWTYFEQGSIYEQSFWDYTVPSLLTAFIAVAIIQLTTKKKSTPTKNLDEAKTNA